MKYLLDTDTCIYLIRKRPAATFHKIEEHKIGEIGISAISYSELTYGVWHSSKPEQNLQALQEFLAPLEVLDYPADGSEAYGRLRNDLQKRGLLIGALDMLIAAHALYLGATLVTNNTTEFNRVPGLRIENWL